MLAIEPGSSHALYYEAVALAQLGRGAEAAAIMGIDRFVRIAPLLPPAAFGGADAFRAALAAEIRANPTLRPDPAAHTTSGGMRTLAFPMPGDQAGAALTGRIREAVAAYAADLAGDHPFVRGRPARASLTAWAILLSGAGRQRLHHHPRPWMTGVYYVTAPPPSGKAGAIRIGPLPAWAGVAPPWPVRDVPPVPGTLILFPSFVPHETVPTRSEAERISVAFDVDRAEE